MVVDVQNNLFRISHQLRYLLDLVLILQICLEYCLPFLLAQERFSYFSSNFFCSSSSYPIGSRIF